MGAWNETLILNTVLHMTFKGQIKSKTNLRYLSEMGIISFIEHSNFISVSNLEPKFHIQNLVLMKQ